MRVLPRVGLMLMLERRSEQNLSWLVRVVNDAMIANDDHRQMPNLVVVPSKVRQSY